METEEKYCPECGGGYKIRKDERLPEDCSLDFWMSDDGTFNWSCHECGHEWKEKRDAKGEESE